MGLRVWVKLPQGSLEGNVIHVEGSQVHVRGTLKCMEKGAKTRKSATETVTWSNCKVVEDSLAWLVVVTGPFIKKLLHNHSINIK